jgi:hypothetical protein
VFFELFKNGMLGGNQNMWMIEKVASILFFGEIQSGINTCSSGGSLCVIWYIWQPIFSFCGHAMEPGFEF